MFQKILGLDLGTNSIGWALVEQDFDKKTGKILGMGSRIIPMSQDVLGDFGKGNSISQTSERTKYRSVRRLRERYLLRRERLHRVLNIMNFLPDHFSAEIDFEKSLGQFYHEKEPKLAYKSVWNEAKQNFDYEFIFKQSFAEMLSNFRASQPEVLKNDNGKDLLIPYDWTIYYLRKKALTNAISKEELAWIILNFNQKRGYNKLRGEEEEDNPNKLLEFHSLKVIDVVADEPQKGGKDIWYSLYLENGWIYRRSSKNPLFDWIDKVREFIVTVDLNDDGSVKTDKEGKEKRSFRAPAENDWTLIKKKTEQEIENLKKTVGTFIYDSLLQNPKQKIKGKLVRTIERKFYKSEIQQIIKKQIELQPGLFNSEIYNECIRELYRNNEHQQIALSNRGFEHLFVEDIIFYQRPLKSKKSSIGNCSLEFRKYKDSNDVEIKQFLKAIPKSNPYYQEFRIWQWIFNLAIYDKVDDQIPITSHFLQGKEDFLTLFDFLNNREEIEEISLLKFLVEQNGVKGKAVNIEVQKYRWNYVTDKAYPCNETKTLINSRLAKVAGIKPDFLTSNIEHQLWHIIYSVTDKVEFEKALKTFSIKYEVDEITFVEAFKKCPPFKSEYGSFSEKAIKKLLPLMRLGKYWKWEAIDKDSKVRIENMLSGEYNESIKDRVREKALHLKEENHFQGLQLWLAQYIVYGRHSEANFAGKWSSVDDLSNYIQEFKQHSLRNPIVEQIITETLRVVRDIWSKFGHGSKNYFDEIHIELGREMKNTAQERKYITSQITENENTNLRIKALLAEMLKDADVQNVRPYSPMQQEILKIYEDGILKSDIEIDEDIIKISKTAQPSSSDLKRYKLWLEQRYRSPYTGAVIPLNRLFTPDYQIEHIIPQSRYFDDSFSNKVICESVVNALKDNNLGLSFIKNFHGTSVGNGVKIFEVAEYEAFVNQHYSKIPGKRTKLLMEEIPEKMIERQLNDTRYISKFIMGLLSNIVRTELKDDGVNSKNVIPVNGKITNQLKQDWGLNDVWNDLVLPRFERLNKITNSSDFTSWNENHQKYLPTVPLDLSKGFSKKRIDHRHHALDALIIACTTRDHVNLLNNQAAKSDVKRYDLQRKLRSKELYFNEKENRQKDAFKEFYKPWESFTQDSRLFLENIIVSFKNNIRVINKATNHYEKWVEKYGIRTKDKVVQKGTNWAIRKPMHKETVAGKIDIPWIKLPKGKILTATRKSLDTTFDQKTIESITDTGIQKILKNYLISKGNNSEIAFSVEGVEDLNKNIRNYNDGKFHQPIIKVRIFEQGSKFPLGQTGNKKDKYVEAAKGTNLFFAVYADSSGKRSYETIPLNEVIESQKQGLNPVPKENQKGERLEFYLSPSDLVVIPTDDEKFDFNINSINGKDALNGKIYKLVSFSGTQAFFIKHQVATSIVNKLEFSTLNKMERDIDGIMVKEKCVPLKVDRLGNISRASYS